jgi:hypothetical protein
VEMKRMDQVLINAEDQLLGGNINNNFFIYINSEIRFDAKYKGGWSRNKHGDNLV